MNNQKNFTLQIKLNVLYKLNWKIADILKEDPNILSSFSLKKMPFVVI